MNNNSKSTDMMNQITDPARDLPARQATPAQSTPAANPMPDRVLPANPTLADTLPPAGAHHPCGEIPATRYPAAGPAPDFQLEHLPAPAGHDPDNENMPSWAEIMGDIAEHERLEKIQRRHETRRLRAVLGRKITREITKYLNNEFETNLLFSCEYWYPSGFVSIEPIDQKHARVEIGNEKIVVERYDTTDIKGLDHRYSKQWTGYLGDDYSGYILYPLPDGRYFAVRYAC